MSTDVKIIKRICRTNQVNNPNLNCSNGCDKLQNQTVNPNTLYFIFRFFQPKSTIDFILLSALGGIMDKRCENCHATFQTHPAVRNHRYFGKLGCQKERKRLWQRHKLAIGSVYREEQADAKRQWRVNNSDYWRKYRESHPAYVERNREQQRERNHKRPRSGTVPCTRSLQRWTR